MPTQTVISINRQTPIMGPATFYPRVVVERLRFTGQARDLIETHKSACLQPPYFLFAI